MRIHHWLAVLVGTFLTWGINPNLQAQVNYDQQQWWNPGDWFDDKPQYNLYTDEYWSDTYDGTYDTDDYGLYDSEDRTSDYAPYGYGSYDPRDDDYNTGYYDTWDYDDSEWGLNDESWNDDHSGIGSAGEYESGFGSESDE